MQIDKTWIFLAFACSAACAHQNKSQEPVKATMTQTGYTTYDTTPAGQASNEPIRPVEECKNVLTCYSALARDLCMTGDPTCTSTFEVTAPVDNKALCENMLSKARDVARPYVESRKDYKFPRECRD